MNNTEKRPKLDMLNGSIWNKILGKKFVKSIFQDLFGFSLKDQCVDGVTERTFFYFPDAFSKNHGFDTASRKGKRFDFFYRIRNDNTI